MTTCPKCSGAMQPGFLARTSLDSMRPDDWVEGEPERSLWFGTRVRDKTRARITAVRCERCGYVELYAKARQSAA